MADPPSKLTGTVKWFNSTRGFGFITPDDGGEDLFVHQMSIHSDGFRSLNDGESVEYVVEQGDDGRARAVDVTGPDGAFVLGSRRREGFVGAGGGRGGGSYGSGGARGGRGRGGRGGGRYGGNAYGGGSSGGGGYGGGGGGGACYNCGEVGHLARDCPQESSGSQRGNGGGGRACYNCGVPGHLARDCTAAAS